MTAHVHSVALNAMYLAPGDSGGPETYLRELVQALAIEYPRLELTVLTTRSGARALAADGFGELATLLGLPAEEYSRTRRQFAEQLLVQIHARRSGAQLLHSLGGTGPVITPGLRSVVTLHDVTFMRIPTFGRVTTWGMKFVIPRAARDADALIAVSAAARDDVCSMLGLDPAHFTVVPHGIRRAPRAEPAPEQPLRERLALGGRIALCVAAVRPHKNQELLVRALPQLPDDTVIVFAGKHEPYADQVRGLAVELGVSERVRLAGYVSNAELERLWELAACAAFPTRAEGFGLPVLEALARGVPVACSDIPALREVGGEVPHYFDPADPRSAAAAVEAAMADPRAGAAGPARADRFSWAEAARGTMEAYERALAAGRTRRVDGRPRAERRLSRDRGDLDLNLRSAPQLREYQAIYDRILRDRPRRVLDWGCGHGHAADALKRSGLDVVALEYDANAPEGSLSPRANFPGVEALTTREPVALPFPDDSFDAVLSLGVLEHVPDPEGSIREMHRVLRPGGRFYVYKLPNRFSYLERIAKLAGLSYHGERAHDTLWTVRSAREALERNGFQVEWARRANMLPLTLPGPVAARLAPLIWRLNLVLSRLPGINSIATNVEALARR